MYSIFKIKNNKIEEFEVTPNHYLEGWSILTEVNPNKQWLDVYPIMNEALERNRFDSIKKSETYVGLGNLVYYNTKEEAQEVLNLQLQFKETHNGK
jgi:hypothetical protein